MKIKIVPCEALERYYLQICSIEHGNIISDIGFSESIGMSIMDYENIAKKYDYKPTISHKSSSDELRAFMAESLPNYDVERVYESDIKKLAQWYNLLQKAGYITPESFVKPEAPAEETVEEANVVEEKAEKKPAAKKAPAKKAAEKTEDAKEEKAPAKKPAAKKATKKEDKE